MNHTLLIDRNYMALSIVSLKKAISLLVRGKAEAVDGSGVFEIVHGVGKKFKVSNIIRLIYNIPWRAHKGQIRFTHKNVFIRDSNVCQYCRIDLNATNRTIDHVIPKSRGGASDYANCVASCKDCNNRKGNKMLSQTGMKLLKKPKTPGFTMVYRKYITSKSPKEWADYIIG